MARQSRRTRSQEPEFLEERPIRQRHVIEPFVPKSKKQEKYLHALENFTVVFGVGAAGTGKSHVSTAYAADQLREGSVSKLIFTRPNVEVGRPLGHLPGTLEEKFEPYLMPVKEILYERLGKSHTEALIKSGKIEAIPLGFMRGMTFKDCIVIVDEAQNCAKAEFLMLLTRLGYGSKMFINGDTSQTDLREKSGLEDSIERVSWIPQVAVVEFNKEDVVRAGIVSEIIESYED